MKRDLIIYLFVAFVLAGCTSAPAANPTNEPVMTEPPTVTQPTAEPTLTAAPQPTVEQEAKLTGRVWKWHQTLMSDDSVHKPADSARYTIEFGADGGAAILADCNQVSGKYQLDGHNMTIESGATTLMACPSESLDSVYLKDLGEINNYFFNDGALFLGLKYDSGVMEFRP